MHSTMQQISLQQVARPTVSILRPRSRVRIARQLTSCLAQQVKARWCIDIRCAWGITPAHQAYDAVPAVHPRENFKTKANS